jgi:hypothetical protein
VIFRRHGIRIRGLDHTRTITGYIMCVSAFSLQQLRARQGLRAARLDFAADRFRPPAQHRRQEVLGDA